MRCERLYHMKEKRKSVIAPSLVFALTWLSWAAWTLFAVPRLPLSPVVGALIDSVAAKALVWLLPLVLLRKLRRKELFQGSFPWLACLILLCASAVFLHTLRLLNGLLNTHVIFDPMFLVFSLSAGVLEELSFRGGFFEWIREKHGFWCAALLNGAMFTLYHYPELLLGQWQGLISLRAVLIFSMGVIFCWMYRRWRNLALNMTVHTVWDILSYLFCLVG